MESFLQVFYALIAIYGWRKWKNSDSNLPNILITSMKKREHFIFISFILILTSLSGFLMSYTKADFPYLDSFTTIGAIFTTFLVAKRILENWLYWIIIDSFSIYIYLEKNLYITSFLFMLYLVLALFGYFSWRRLFYDGIK
jgi:nicotinamide mononucleotide transporter